MRLLGWGRLTMYPKNLHILDDGSLKEDSKQVYRPDFSLNDMLCEIYRDAKNTYLHSVPMDATEETIEALLEKHLPDIERAESMIEQARNYKLDIVDELARGALSGLRLDMESTAKAGEEHITIRSLDEWASAKYPVVAEVECIPAEDDPSIGVLHKPVSEMSKTEKGLYTVLALVTEAYAKKLGSTYMSKSGEVNIMQTAEKVAAHADTYMESDKHFPRQSINTVRSRLTTAEKCLSYVKRMELPKKRC